MAVDQGTPLPDVPKGRRLLAQIRTLTCVLGVVVVGLSAPTWAEGAGDSWNSSFGEKGEGLPSWSFKGSIDTEMRYAGSTATLAVTPDLHLKAEWFGGALVVGGRWSKDGPGSGPYRVQRSTEDLRLVLWGGGQSEKRWADKGGLLVLPGKEKVGPRLRVENGAWGIDHTAARTGLRWEAEQKVGRRIQSVFGVLGIWHGADMDGPGEDDEECECDWDDPLLCEGCADEGGSSGSGPKAEEESGVPVPLVRAAAYGGWYGREWRVEGTLAGASVADHDAGETQGRALAHALLIRRDTPFSRIEAKEWRREAGFRKSGSPYQVRRECSVAVAARNLGGKVVARQDIEGEHPGKMTYSLSLAGRKGLSPARIASLYTHRQVERAKTPGWRVHGVWVLDTRSLGSDTSHKEYPWLLPIPGMSRWVATLEALLPLPARAGDGFTSGGIGVRVSVGESANGRMNWWYPRLAGGKALTSLSHSAARLEALLIRNVGKEWQVTSQLVFAEEVKHRISEELPRGVYWAWQSSVQKKLTEHVRVCVSFGWERLQEYSGNRGEEAVQGLRVVIDL